MSQQIPLKPCLDTSIHIVNFKSSDPLNWSIHEAGIFYHPTTYTITGEGPSSSSSSDDEDYQEPKKKRSSK